MEAIPMKFAKGVEFLVELIISRYGVPSKLFMDNGTRFRGNKLKNFVINITLKENFPHLIIPKVMVNPKHLIRLLRVSYPKLS